MVFLLLNQGCVLCATLSRTAQKVGLGASLGLWLKAFSVRRASFDYLLPLLPMIGTLAEDRELQICFLLLYSQRWKLSLFNCLNCAKSLLLYLHTGQKLRPNDEFRMFIRAKAVYVLSNSMLICSAIIFFTYFYY